MPDKKLTDKEIVKALECCCGIEHDCDKCPYEENDECGELNSILKDALDLINRLQAENERLKEVNEKLLIDFNGLSGVIKRAQAEALKKAASKFAGHSDYHGDTILCKLYCMAEGKEVDAAKPLDMSEIKAEAYKEFAELLFEKAERRNPKKEEYHYVLADDIVDLLKELESEKQ